MNRTLEKPGAWLRLHEEEGFEYALILILAIIAIASSLSTSSEPPPPAVEVSPQTFQAGLNPEA